MKPDASESGPPRDNGPSTHPPFRGLTKAGGSPLGRIGSSLLIGLLVILLLSGCDAGFERFSPSTPTRVQPTSTVPSTTGTEAPTADGGTATAAPDSTDAPTAAGIVLPVSIAAVPVDMPEYNRDTWRHWTDEDGDCRNARQEVLIDESSIAVTFQSEDQCRVAAGLWVGPYTGTTAEDPGDLDVDHMVPLANAHRSGGWQWSRERKREYANYMGYENHLIATTSRANRSKGSKGPEEWRPPLEDYWCTYATDWVSIKNEWGLTVTEEEYVALSEMLTTCETTVLLQPTQGTPPPLPTPTVPPPSLPADLRYDPFGPDRDCGDFDTYDEALAFFLAAGGPDNDRHRLDVNGDGLPCEKLPGGPSAIPTHDGHDGLAAAGDSSKNVIEEEDRECVATGPPQPTPFAVGYAQSDCGPASAPAPATPATAIPTPLPTPITNATPVPIPLPTPVPTAAPALTPLPTPPPLSAPTPRPTGSAIVPESQPEAESPALTAPTDSPKVPVLEPTRVLPAFVGLPFDPNGPDRNCGDFSSWWDAQNFYLASGGPAIDPHRLDRNSDGTACESLPGAPRSDSGPDWQYVQPTPTATPQPVEDARPTPTATPQPVEDAQPTPTATPQPAEDEFQDRNCGDFDTWQEAQDFFLAEGGPSEDPHRLDGDGDGYACESLPGAPQSDSGPGGQDAPPTPTATPPAAEDEFQDRNCSDFDTWQEAQDFFLAEGGPSQDPHRLDGDGNGIACQSLPGAPDG